MPVPGARALPVGALALGLLGGGDVQITSIATAVVA